MGLFGYIEFLFIGISLGLIGGGGFVLTVLVLVYLFSVEPVTASAYSLFLVGATSVVGVCPKYFKRLGQQKIYRVIGQKFQRNLLTIPLVLMQTVSPKSNISLDHLRLL